MKAKSKSSYIGNGQPGAMAAMTRAVTAVIRTAIVNQPKNTPNQKG